MFYRTLAQVYIVSLLPSKIAVYCKLMSLLSVVAKDPVDVFTQLLFFHCF